MKNQHDQPLSKKMKTAFLAAFMFAILMIWYFTIAQGQDSMGDDLVIPGLGSGNGAQWIAWGFIIFFALAIIVFIGGQLQINLSNVSKNLKGDKVWDGEKWVYITYDQFEKDVAKTNGQHGIIEDTSTRGVEKFFKVAFIVLICSVCGIFPLIGGLIRIFLEAVSNV